MNLIVDDLDVRLEVEGEGKSVLMIHGWKDQHETFDKLASKLSKDYQVIRLDLPGFGSSQMPRKPWGVSRYADFIFSVLEKLEIKELYAAIGHSMGGRVLMNAVGRDVLEPQKLILLASAGIPDKSDSKKKLYKIAAKSGKAATSMLPKDQQEKLRKKLYKMAGSDDYLDSGEMRETFTQIINEDSRPYAAKIRTRTLLIYGSEDQTTPPTYGEELNSLIKDSQLVVIDGVRHNIHKHKTQKVYELIQEFLK